MLVVIEAQQAVGNRDPTLEVLVVIEAQQAVGNRDSTLEVLVVIEAQQAVENRNPKLKVLGSIGKLMRYYNKVKIVKNVRVFAWINR